MERIVTRQFKSTHDLVIAELTARYADLEAERDFWEVWGKAAVHALADEKKAHAQTRERYYAVIHEQREARQVAA